MPVSTKIYLIAIIPLLVTAFITYGVYSTENRSSILYTQNIPTMVDNWYGIDIPVEEKTHNTLETRDILMREYRKSQNERVTLTLVFSQSNRKVTHPPDVCFTGDGWSQIDKDTQKIPIGEEIVEFNRLILQRGDNYQIALYSYKSGSKITSNYYVQQFNTIKNSVLHKRSSIALISISSFTSDDIEKSTKLIIEFAMKITPLLKNSLP